MKDLTRIDGYEAIAEHLGISASALRKRIQRGSPYAEVIYREQGTLMPFAYVEELDTLRAGLTRSLADEGRTDAPSDL